MHVCFFGRPGYALVTTKNPLVTRWLKMARDWTKIPQFSIGWKKYLVLAVAIGVFNLWSGLQPAVRGNPAYSQFKNLSAVRQRQNFPSVRFSEKRAHQPPRTEEFQNSMRKNLTWCFLRCGWFYVEFFDIRHYSTTRTQKKTPKRTQKNNDLDARKLEKTSFLVGTTYGQQPIRSAVRDFFFVPAVRNSHDLNNFRLRTASGHAHHRLKTPLVTERRNETQPP